MSHPAALAYAWRRWADDPSNRLRVVRLQHAARANVPALGRDTSHVIALVADRLRSDVPLHEAVRP